MQTKSPWSSLIVTMTLALSFLAVVITTCIMLANGRAVPAGLTTLGALIVGILAPSPATHTINDLTGLLKEIPVVNQPVEPVDPTPISTADPYPGGEIPVAFNSVSPASIELPTIF